MEALRFRTAQYIPEMILPGIAVLRQVLCSSLARRPDSRYAPHGIYDTTALAGVMYTTAIVLSQRAPSSTCSFCQ